MTKYNLSLSGEELSRLDRQTQISLMRKWFFEHFEHPAERLPFDSGEGGYQWIWGGPFNAGEELSSEFGDYVPAIVIRELEDELNADSTEWAPTEMPGDYEDYVFSVISSEEHPYDQFISALSTIDSLLGLSAPETIQAKLHQLLFSNTIAALEAYLSGLFIRCIGSDRTAMRRFVETTPDFRKEKLMLSEIFSEYEQIDRKVRVFLLDLVWHNLAKVCPMYKQTLDIDFPADMQDIYSAILVRHDIVHRNGKNKDGTDVEVDVETVRQLMTAVKGFVDFIKDQYDLQFTKLL